MSGALESVCKALSLKMIDDHATRVVAQKIIEMAQSGVRGADTCTLWPSGNSKANEARGLREAATGVLNHWFFRNGSKRSAKVAACP